MRKCCKFLYLYRSPSQINDEFESFLDAVTSNYGLRQLIQESRHILNLSPSCIDLIFTSQPNLVMESGVNSSLHPNCHQHVVFAKFVLSILYPPPYERTVWFYEKTDPNVSVDEKVCYFTKTLLNIIHNFIPHERIFVTAEIHLG